MNFSLFKILSDCQLIAVSIVVEPNKDRKWVALRISVPSLV